MEVRTLSSTSTHNGGSLSITFYRTTGVSTPNISESQIFSDVSVSESNGNTTFTLSTLSSGALWGYAVEYSGGTTNIVCRARPELSEGDQPLSGVRIALDPGHGGKDNGTSGIATGTSWVEKDANLATARIVRDKLEQAGATVIMVRNSDTKIELTDRMNHAQRERVDLYISLHCNSSSNKSTTGVEVYYHHPFSSSLASTMMSEFTSATGRKQLKSTRSHYVVTLGTFAPAILLEMGFMTNTSEYNNLVSQDGIAKAAQGVYNGIISALR